MTVRNRPFSSLFAFAVAAALAFCGSAVLAQTPEAHTDTHADAHSSDFNLNLHANSHATASDVGLPGYPGAILFKSKDDDASADLGLVLGDFNFQLKAVSYVTSDSPQKVLAFYRKPLSQYGEVLECDHGKPVGSLTVTRSGLTCADQKDGNIQVNGSGNSSKNHELRAGSPRRFRIVGIDDSHQGSTRFGLVYLELPKDDDKSKK